MGTLSDYINEQLRAGYNVADVKTYLAQQGYTQSQIDEAFNSLNSKYNQSYYPSQESNTQDNKQETSEVYRQQLQQMGYSEDQIQAYLQQQNLPQQHQEQNKSMSLSDDLEKLNNLLSRFGLSMKTFIIICVGLFCIIAMVTAMILMSGPSTPKPIIYNEPNEPIENDPFEDDFPIKDDEPIINEPDDEPEVIIDDKPNEDPITDDEPDEDPFSDEPEVITPTKPPKREESQVETFEFKLKEIISTASTDKEGSKAKCESFDETIYTDECFYQLTVKTTDIVYCSYISNDAKHDRCLMNHAMKVNDFSGCAKYKTLDLKTTCEELASE